MSSRKSLGDEENKHVWVDVVGGSANIVSMEIEFKNSPRSGKTDISCIVEEMKSANNLISQLLKEAGYVFERESTFKPGKWVAMGDASVVSSGSELRCTLLQHFSHGNYCYNTYL
jgi:hypothetical protein